MRQMFSCFSFFEGSNHYGIAGWYTIRAMNQGFIGLSSTNTSPLMCPTRSMEAGLGTNPISFAAPADEGDSFVLDMVSVKVSTKQNIIIVLALFIILGDDSSGCWED